MLLLLAPLFYADIQPILERRCVSCHAAGEAAPMSLTTWEEVRPWAKAIREAVVSKRMPPWPVAAHSVPLANDPRLSEDEIRAIDQWVTAGAPRDARKTTRKTPVADFKSDLTVRMPTTVTVPARKELPYQFIVVPIGLTEDRWVQAVRVRPEQRQVVHHVVAYLRPPGSDWMRDAPKGVPFVRAGVTTADILAVWAPGQPPAVYPDRMAKRIEAGSDLVLQMHYTPAAKTVSDRTSVDIQFAASAPDYNVLTLQIATTDIHIPPGDRNYSLSASGTMPNDALLLSLFPHMHLRGKAFEYTLTGSGGQVETLLRIAPYRFNWQFAYQLQTPRLLKKGTRLRCTAWYDNSLNNPLNPDPAAEVGYGEQSWEEMMVGFFDVAVPVAIDKRQFFVR